MLDRTAVDQIKKTLRGGIEHGETAGANLMILQGGKELLYHEDGFADRENGIQIRRDTIFRLYSMTKPVTAVAAMLLLERGEIDLFDPVGKFLPGFRNQRVDAGGSLVPAEREVVVRDLLSMTSGLLYGGSGRAGQDGAALFQEIGDRLSGDSPMGTVEAANRMGQCALAFQPGSLWQYGTSADVLGAVTEVVSGMRFGKFLKKEILDPLGMKDTAFWVPPEKKDRLAKAYEDDGTGNLVPYTGSYLGIVNRMDREPAFESGGAGLASTIDDYARFARMLMNGGSLDGVRILRPGTVRYLTSGTLNGEQQKGMDQWPTFSGYTYGNLMRGMADCGKAAGLASPGEYGWDGWLGAYFCNCPREDLTFLFMIQKTNAGTTPLTRKLRNIILSSCG